MPGQSKQLVMTQQPILEKGEKIRSGTKDNNFNNAETPSLKKSVIYPGLHHALGHFWTIFLLNLDGFNNIGM